MTNNGYLTMGLAIGIAVGSAAGAAITYFTMKKKCEDRIQEEIDAFKDEYKEYSPRYPHFDDLDAGELDEKTNAKHHKTIAASSLDGGPVDIPRAEYHKMASNYKKHLEDVVAENESPMDDDEEEEIDNGDIYIISAEEFNTSDYESVNLIYYAAEEALFEGVDEIDDPETLVGSCLDNLDIPEGEEGTLCIRNEALHMDYEIDVLWDKYEMNDN